MKNILLLLIGILLISFPGSAQDEEIEKVDPSFSISYQKESDGTKVLMGTAKYRKDRVWTRITDLEITFYYLLDGEESKLASTQTDENGLGMLKVHTEIPIPADEDGYMTFLARTSETELFESTEEEIMIIDLFLEMELLTEDDEKQIIARAYTINIDGEKEPMSDEDLFFYVPRMFSDLQVSEGYLEEGETYAEFPSDLIGDEDGNLEVIARLVEHDEYGTVEVRMMSNWGISQTAHLQEHPSKGELWTPVAPMWMIVTLIILLLGVWGHYFYTVVQLFLIRKEGKELEQK
jgi:hypothetical protein